MPQTPQIEAREGTSRLWRTIPEYENYVVSDGGEIMRIRLGRGTRGIRVLSTTRVGYPRVSLCQDGVVYSCYVHRLVARTFLGPNPLGMEVNHQNGNKRDSRISNLEYVTSGENKRHAYSLGLMTGRKNVG